MSVNSPNDVQLAYALGQSVLEESPKLAHRRRDGIEPMPVLLWTSLYRCFLAPDVPFTLNDHKDLRDIYQCNARQVCIKKAGQRGVSEILITRAFHACDERKLNVLYLMPTQRGVYEFSQSRIDPAMQASPYLAGLIQPVVEKTNGRRNKPVDNKAQKKIGTNWLYMKGGTVGKTDKGDEGSADQLKSFQADVLYVDERNEQNSQTVSIAKRRMNHSPIKEIWQISTPTYAGTGIDLEWEISDQREWFVDCPHCKKKQVITINSIVVEWDDFERPVAWHGMKQNTAWAACKRCGKPLDRLADGEWVAAKFGREMVGFHPTNLTAPHMSLLEIVRNGQTLDEAERREWLNQDLGENYTPRGGKLDEATLNACRRDYAMGHSEPDLVRVMGVDIGPRLKNVVVRELTRDGRYKLVYAGEVGTFAEVGRLLKLYDVRTSVLDALPETEQARDLQAGHRDGLIWLSYFPWSDKGSKETEPVVWDKKDGVVNCDRTRVFDGTYARFYGQENLLPANADQIPNYYLQLKAPTRVFEKDSRGNLYARYTEGSAADHFALAEVYCYVASLRESWWMW